MNVKHLITRNYNIRQTIEWVLFGPLPHSTSGKNDSSSVIAEMKSKEGYPRIETLNAGNKLKITKSNFKSTLERLIQENYI